MVSGRSWVQLLVTELAVLIALTRAEVVSLEGTAPRLAILRDTAGQPEVVTAAATLPPPSPTT